MIISGYLLFILGSVYGAFSRKGRKVRKAIYFSFPDISAAPREKEIVIVKAAPAKRTDPSFLRMTFGWGTPEGGKVGLFGMTVCELGQHSASRLPC